MKLCRLLLEWVNCMASQVMSLSGRAQLMGFPGYHDLQTYFLFAFLMLFIMCMSFYSLTSFYPLVFISCPFLSVFFRVCFLFFCRAFLSCSEPLIGPSELLLTYSVRFSITR